LSEGHAVAQITAPITGSVWKILVAPGDQVQAGETVAILESIKLEILVEADVGGTILAVLAGEGDVVAEGSPIFSCD
jgi:biotin carboxyl carrier protein